MARLLSPESAPLEVVVREVGICAGTLVRGGAVQLKAVITTAAMTEAAKSAWCRGHGVFPVDLDKWRASCTTALSDPEDARASPQATRADRKRIDVTERASHRHRRAHRVHHVRHGRDIRAARGSTQDASARRLRCGARAAPELLHLALRRVLRPRPTKARPVRARVPGNGTVKAVISPVPRKPNSFEPGVSATN